jgi:formylglycine-generating enzyme required for sulfatase activity
VTVACADDAAPNAWASWPLSEPTTENETNSQAFTVDDDVATDDVTKLVWQRHSPIETFTWPEAKQYCACLSLAGHEDWQLPSRMELVSIVDYTKLNPSIDEGAFPDTPFEWFWSASALAGADRYWYVAFFDGDTHAASPEQEYRARCVRRAVGQLPRYDLSLPGAVKDASTGLTWQRDATIDQLTWSDAKLACGALALAGGGWRLPSMSELQSLIDETQADPAIDAAAFPDTPSEGFWAATPLAGSTTAAWFVSFREGIAYNALLEHAYRVRCVR